MPEISRFFGIIIRMFYNEHNPPHFHAYYNEFVAEITINDLQIIAGSLPKKAIQLVSEWATEHKEELMKDWELMRNDSEPLKINPLQ